MIKVLFFGQLRDQLSSSGLEVVVDGAVTVSQLLDTLVAQEPTWKQELNSSHLLVAVNQAMATKDTLIDGPAEVAFFPPVTGG